jgi:hypothetical protein
MLISENKSEASEERLLEKAKLIEQTKWYKLSRKKEFMNKNGKSMKSGVNGNPELTRSYNISVYQYGLQQIMNATFQVKFDTMK